MNLLSIYAFCKICFIEIIHSLIFYMAYFPEIEQAC